MKTIVFSATPESITKISGLLRGGEVVALPTETVYGLAGNAISPQAVLKIFEAKERPSFDPLIVHVSDRVLSSKEGPVRALVNQKIISEEVLKWGCLTEIDSAMKKFWPGPLTFILPRGGLIPDEVTSRQKTVGIRSPAHPLFQAILQNLDFPLAAPSANRFGRISPTDAHHVLSELDGRIAAVLEGGACSVGLESTIIRIENPLKITLLRPGKIGVEELKNHFKIEIDYEISLVEKNQSQIAPGMLDEHYAPSKPLILVPISFADESASIESMKNYAELEGDAYLSMSTVSPSIQKRKNSQIKILSVQNSLVEMAKTLFAQLRELDADPNVKLIYCDIPSDRKEGLSFAIRDRMRRASRNKPVL